MRIILHIDMDAFFAQIEERENPAFKGKPIVVGADPQGGRGRGVVSTANYAARKFGIRSALPISKAWQLCSAPQCVYLPVDGVLYGKVSERIMKLIREVVEHTPPLTPPRQGGEKFVSSPLQGEVRRGLVHFEQVSIDEAYIEIKNAKCKMKNCWIEAEKIAQELKREILKQERLTCSVGIGPNKLVAKIASDFKKPDGLTVVPPDKVEAFLSPLPVRKLPGIGPKTEALLARRGIQTVADLRLALPDDDKLYQKARGQDDTPVVEVYAAKSIGHETTFAQDTRDEALLTRVILGLCDEVLEEVRKGGLDFKTITVRVRFDNFETHTSAQTLREATPDGIILKRETLRLLFPYFRKKRWFRLVGVRVSNLQERR